MKINHGYTSSAQDSSKTQETAAAAQTRSAKAGAGAGKSGSGDEVNLSSLASALQGALTDSPERAAYIEQLSAEFTAGTYKPNSAATASGLIDDSLLDSK